VTGPARPGSLPASRRENLARFSQISRILVRHGFGFVLDVRRERREERGLEELLAPNFGVRLRRALDDLGPTFVKFGQLLSTRQDLLPEGVLVELQKLQSTVSPMPVGTAQAVIARELGAPVEELFAAFNGEALGSASIGQVHRARLRTGEAVAVKVQRPEAARRVTADLQLMRDLANLIGARFGDRILIDIPGLVAEFEGVILRELDFEAEAQNARRFAANFAETPVKIPAVYTDLSTKRVLTMEFIEGDRFYRIEPRLLVPAERRRVATMGADAIFKMAFDDGFFHGDPHPGNLILTPEKNLALLDFGMVGYLSRGDVEALSRLFLAVIRRDADWALRGLEALGVRYAPEVRPALVQDLRGFLFKYSGLTVGETTLGQALGEVISLARRHRLSLPPVFPLLVKALVTAEALARSIDPTLNVYEVARPYARRLLLERYEPKALARRTEDLTVEYARYLADYPDQVRQLLLELEDGSLEVKLQHRGMDRLIGEVDMLPNRLVFAVVTAALLVGSSMLGAFATGGPVVPLLGVPLVAFVGFVLAAALAVLLLVVVYRGGRL